MRLYFNLLHLLRDKGNYLKIIFRYLFSCFYALGLVLTFVFLFQSQEINESRSVFFIIFLYDFVIKRVYVKGIFTTFSHFVYLQVKRRTIFFFFLLDSLLSFINILSLILFIFAFFIFKLDMSYFFSFLLMIVVVNPVVERISRLICRKNLLTLFIVVAMYFYLLTYIGVVNIVIVTIVNLSLLMFLFKQKILIK